MCLLIYRPAGKVVKEEYLANGHAHNNDACGFSWALNGKINIRKGIWKFDKFIEEYNKVKDLNAPFIIHFRASTGGDGVLNAHPFLFCKEKYVMAHNGMLPIRKENNWSDSLTFTNLVLEPMLNFGIEPDAPYFKYLVQQAIGVGNKISLMDSAGKVTIYNEHQGDWNKEDDCWYSNFSYKWAKTFFKSWGGNEYWKDKENRSFTPTKKNDSGTDGSQAVIKAAYAQLSDNDKIKIWFLETEFNITQEQALEKIKENPNYLDVEDEVINV